MATTDITRLPILPVVGSRLAGNSVLIFITMLVVALRYMARLVTGSRVGWDDYLILAAIPQVIGMLVCQGLWSVLGPGYRIEDVPAGNFLGISTLFVPFELLYNSTIVTTKLSVLFFYLRVFTHGSMRRATQWMMVLVGVLGAANLVQSFLVCRIHDGHVTLVISRCTDNTASLVATGLFNCLTNLVIGLLPLYTIWSLSNVTVSSRLGLTAIFLVGVSVTLVSIYRISILASPANKTQPLIATATITFLSVLEVTLSILCNSLPMLLPLYSYWRYRKVYAEDQDEYVSRIRGDSTTPTPPRKFMFEDVTNGLPLETIYGQDNVHYSMAIGTGDTTDRPKTTTTTATKKPSSPDATAGHTRGRGLRGQFTDSSEGGPSRKLPGITIETKWTITEEMMANPYKKI